MDIIVAPKRTFMAKFERFEPLVHDPTARVAAKKCTRFYFYKLVLGMTPRTSVMSYPLIFGSAYHKFREVLTRAAAKGNEDGALKIALEAAVRKWPGDPPAGSKFEFLTQARLAKSCLVAYNHWKRERELGRIKIIQPEQPFDLLMSDGKTRAGGRLDEGVRWNGKPCPRDFKSTSRTINWWNRRIDPNDQFTCYIWGYGKLAGEPVNTCIIEILRNTKSDGPEIHSLATSRTDGQIERWEMEQIHFEKIIDLCREADIWPMEESECPSCEFRSVCTKASESAMIAQLETHFTQKPWDFKTLGEDDEDYERY